MQKSTFFLRTVLFLYLNFLSFVYLKDFSSLDILKVFSKYFVKLDFFMI